MIMKNKFLVFLISLCLVPSSFAANIPMDYMEYADDEAAEAAYVIPATSGGTGGTVTTSGGYTYHTFKSDSTFHANGTLTAEILVIGGGASGGASVNGYAGGGGGSGGILYHSELEIVEGDVTVTVGDGGVQKTTAGDGNSGEDSFFGDLQAMGGGGGNAYDEGGYGAGKNGGSGGGGENSSGTSTSTQTSNNGGTGYGNAGGAGGTATTGGGGGAGAAGTSGNGSVCGAGGAGKNTWSTWATATSTGVDGYYAGGGGGGSSTSGNIQGAGGSGGGGAGGAGEAPVSGVAATANTGSGGGGSGYYNTGGNHYGGAGGSGLVIVKYLTPSPGFVITTEETIKTQGSYSLKGTAMDEALNSVATRTVTPTLNLSDQKMLKFDIRSSRTGSNIKIGIHDSGGTTTETTPNVASANTWQTVVWDISAVSNANKDGIDQIIVTVVNADAANTFYLDNFRCSVANDVFGSIE